jgi:2-polyprenyl-3-methyl-5-hydroxy-6-metoxy-1,4-benzoquinol methylase
MTRGPLVDDGVVIGNVYDKRGSEHPIVRRLMAGFDRGLDELLVAAGPARSVLEVGCGEGHVTARLAARFPGARVLGTDFSPRIVEVARRAHPDLSFEVCSIYDTARLGTWDLVVACEVFEHLDRPAEALDAICDARAGHVLVTVPREPLWRALNLARGRYWGALGNTPGHVQHWSRGSLLRFLARRLEIEAVRTPTPWTQVLGRPRARSTP